MKSVLLNERYSVAIISFILFSSLIGKPVLSSPGDRASISVSISTTNAGVLTCTHPSTTLTASMTASGSTTYSWTGPNGFADPEQTADVTDSGTYTVLVTNPANSCSATATVAVTADFTECSMVELSSPQKTHVSVEVYNSAGGREQMLFEGNIKAGVPYKWALDAGRMTPGVHYCIIRTDKKTHTSKLLISGGQPQTTYDQWHIPRKPNQYI